jgi:hypothetical protein
VRRQAFPGFTYCMVEATIAIAIIPLLSMLWFRYPKPEGEIRILVQGLL